MKNFIREAGRSHSAPGHQHLARSMCRRSFVRGLVTASAGLAAGFASGCDSESQATAVLPVTLRKSVSAMSAEEIDRFCRAFAYAVAQGFFDTFNDEHYDHHKHRHHGQDLLASSPMAVATSHHPSAGHRLLPWHRAFILEAEMMLRAALRERNQEEGRDPAEADLLFIPYWDAAHDQGLPDWVLDFQPRGGTATVPPDLPEGHAGYGKPIGSPFADFLTALDVAPEIVASQLGVAQAALEWISVERPDDAAVQTLARAATTPPSTPEEQLAVTNALLAIGYVAAVEAQPEEPDAALIRAIEDLYSLFRFMPHLLLHLWAGGLDPSNAALRGTVTYFQERAVDPVFWMLHTELDRYWYTWEKSSSDQPQLEGDEALFAPLSPEDGAWYGGGKRYELRDLTAHETLPYAYDALFEVQRGATAVPV